MPELKIENLPSASISWTLSERTWKRFLRLATTLDSAARAGIGFSSA